MIYHSNKLLSQKLERTEASANAEFIKARLKMIPDSQAEWIDVNGTYAMYDGAESLFTQTFGLGLFSSSIEADLEILEKFYNRLGALVCHEVSPMADLGLLEILVNKGYQPIELTNILYKQLSNEDEKKATIGSKISSRKMNDGEENLWASTSVEGWCQDALDVKDLMYNYSQLSCKSVGATPYFVHYNDKPISTGLLYIYDDVALLASDSTIPEGRNKGGQNALIKARLNDAIERGCTLAMLVADPGNQSQMNAEKNGFQIAYTRTKWKLSKSS